ncbi:MAG TPA: DUF2117 domain-containing protein [Methanospirillum sp.]|nr:DUF2117 domain-containing protein [Methanospirillum sp.]
MALSSPVLTLIFHGADVFDYGDASRLISLLHPRLSLVAGVMARTAAEESGLAVIYDGRRPSEILSEYAGDQAVLVHRAKTNASAHRFGSIIHSHLKDKGLILIDPGTCQILTWEPGDPSLSAWLSEITGYPVKSGNHHETYPPDTRVIGGCLPGEPVFVNGIIIGYATGEEAVISLQDGTIKAISGIELKDHGVEKLIRFGYPDISKAWCKSGNIRISRPKKGERQVRKGRIAVIDHTAMACYRSFDPDICGLVTIGDDTTSICGHIGCFRGIPVLGITDGDIDGIVPEGYAPGSVVLQAINERDDDVGIEIAGKVSDEPVVWDEWVEKIIRDLDGRVKVVHREY